jgi:hypothetical protein
MAKPQTLTTTTLIDRMERTLTALEQGDITPQDAQARARVAMTIIATANLSITHARFVSETRSGDRDPGALALGSN